MLRTSIASSTKTTGIKPSSLLQSPTATVPMHPNNDTLVVTTKIENFDVNHVLVDNGASVNILEYRAFKGMKLQDHNIILMDSPLYGFVREYILPFGVIFLPVTLGTYTQTSSFMVEFTVVDNQTTHNVIFGRFLLKEMKIVTLIYQLSMKFLTSDGIGIVHGDWGKSRRMINTHLQVLRIRRCATLSPMF